MKTKIGSILPEETIKIILTSIVMIFIMGALTVLYFVYTNNIEIKQAKSSLSYLVERATEGDRQIDLWNPKGWWIVTWPKESSKELPKKCLNKNWNSCICIQEDSTKENSAGFCLENNLKLTLIKQETKIDSSVGITETVDLSSSNVVKQFVSTSAIKLFPVPSSLILNENKQLYNFFDGG